MTVNFQTPGSRVTPTRRVESARCESGAVGVQPAPDEAGSGASTDRASLTFDRHQAVNGLATIVLGLRALEARLKASAEPDVVRDALLASLIEASRKLGLTLRGGGEPEGER